MLLEIVAGALIGYLLVCICESFFHRTIQHASPLFRRLCLSLRTLGGPFRMAWLSHHLIHHCLTYRRNHTTQFDSADEEQALRKRFQQAGCPRALEGDYGIRIGGATDILLYMAPTLPIYALVCFLGGLWFTAGALLPLAVWPLLAQYVHPYLHMTHAEARQRAPRLMRLFMATPYFRYLFRHHWLHHRHPDWNFNLVLGGDFLLGTHRRATEAELREIDDLRHGGPDDGRHRSGRVTSR